VVAQTPTLGQAPRPQILVTTSEDIQHWLSLLAFMTHDAVAKEVVVLLGIHHGIFGRCGWEGRYY
jgi:hypothetical protein